MGKITLQEASECAIFASARMIMMGQNVSQMGYQWVNTKLSLCKGEMELDSKYFPVLRQSNKSQNEYSSRIYTFSKCVLCHFYTSSPGCSVTTGKVQS